MPHINYKIQLVITEVTTGFLNMFSGRVKMQEPRVKTCKQNRTKRQDYDYGTRRQTPGVRIKNIICESVKKSGERIQDDKSFDY
jgi:hypothetical protein